MTKITIRLAVAASLTKFSRGEWVPSVIRFSKAASCGGPGLQSGESVVLTSATVSLLRFSRSGRSAYVPDRGAKPRGHQIRMLLSVAV